MASFLLTSSALPFFVLSASLVAAHPQPTKRDAYSSLGCYTDNVADRALTAAFSADGSMTIDKCAQFCSRYKYFGVEYGSECYCGNTQTTSSLATADAECSQPCSGSASETCGASNRLNVYINNLYSAATHANLDDVNYLGCFQDTGARVLPEKQISTDDMTAAKCAENCAGYQYFGTEWARECFCGNDAPQQSAPESDCSMPCTGNSEELCGAGLRLNVYKRASQTATTTTTSAASTSTTQTLTVPSSIANFQYQGCFTDSVGARVLSGQTAFAANMTLENCASICSAYSHFGVEYSTECYCGLTLASTSKQVTEDQCKMPCGGNAGQNCGGPELLNLFSNPNFSQPSSQNPQQVNSFQYRSCWTDTVHSRVLSGDSSAGDDMSLENCAAYCKNFKYFGVEYSRECYCGNELGGQAAPETECTQHCSGNSTELCGGPNRLNLYALSDLSSTSSTSSSSILPTTMVTITTTTTMFVTNTTATTSSSTIPTTTTTTTITTTTTTTPPPELTTITDCPTKSTYVGSPATCALTFPGNCQALSAQATNYAFISRFYTQCSAQLSATSLLAQASSCFPFTAGGYPRDRTAASSAAMSVYSCVAQASITCQFASSCTTQTYTVGAVPTPTTKSTDLINEGFESDSYKTWTYVNNMNAPTSLPTISSDRARTGTYSMRWTFNNTVGDILNAIKTLNVSPGESYSLTGWYNHDNPQAVSYFALFSNLPGGGFSTPLNGVAAGVWNRFEYNITNVQQSFATIGFWVGSNYYGPNGGSAPDTVYIDDIVLTQIS